MRDILIEFMDNLRDYVAESGTNISYDERDSSDFVDIFLNQGKSLPIDSVSFPLFQELYGSYVQMDDRFETVHIWSEELAIKNKGRWKPLLISKKVYDQEKKNSWNN